MNGRKAVSSDILGLEVGRAVLRGVLLDAAGVDVVNFAEVPLTETVHGPVRKGSIDCSRIGPGLQELLARLGLRETTVFAAGIALGPQFSGVGGGPAFTGWLQAQADGLGRDFVYAGTEVRAFAPRAAIDAAADAARSVGLGLARIDLAPVAAARVLTDPSQEVAAVGSGLGWRIRLRDLEVVEALERPEVAYDAPVQIRSTDGQWEPLTGYRRITVPPGLRAAGCQPGQLAVAVGAAIGVTKRSSFDLLHGTSITAGRPAVAASPVPARTLESPMLSPARRTNPVPAGAGAGMAGTGVRPPDMRSTPQRSSSPTARRPPRPPSTSVHQPSFGGRQRSISHRPPSERSTPATQTTDGWPAAERRPDEGRSRSPRRSGRYRSTRDQVDLLIGFLAALLFVLLPVYLFL